LFLKTPFDGKISQTQSPFEKSILLPHCRYTKFQNPIHVFESEETL